MVKNKDEKYHIKVITNSDIPEEWVIALNMAFDHETRHSDYKYPLVTQKGMEGIVTYNHGFWPEDINIIFHYFGFENKYSINGCQFKESKGNHQDLGDNTWYSFRRDVARLLPEHFGFITD